MLMKPEILCKKKKIKQPKNNSEKAAQVLGVKYDTGYPHDGRADNTAYRHDRRADKRRYPHNREIDIQMLKMSRNGYILS